MNSSTTKKSKKGQVVKTQMIAEHQGEVIVSNPLVDTNTEMKAEAQEEVVLSNTYVETLWNQYEQIVDQARKFHDSSEEAYLKNVKEVIMFNKEYRKSIANFYKESWKFNREIFKGVSSKFEKNDVLKQESDQPVKRVEEFSERLEELAVTPIKLAVDVIERLEKNVEESCETNIHYSRESRRGLQKVTNEFVKIAKDNHKILVNHLEEPVKVLVSANRI
ncbi:hypothetical protein J7E79_14525 [Bacillus sp. ISL-40]|uniref:hypothetical protein n=1 Tax=unclassified Bacillus (in: firmicutes) TaxID=185979 RepID=UPI001BE8EDB1|nr:MULTISPECIES: hypothetical protein [unclassified Bacillus (in: firmicutes)]MBT2698625.1 hypothetical protein [Bacillus sp. ISL-40]MBT2720258.1 hypothetical protein [Bacillus sp. ISL-46]MBT2739148.1 hypothetical protein [Bacillus sp. ISL-77]